MLTRSSTVRPIFASFRACARRPVSSKTLMAACSRSAAFRAASSSASRCFCACSAVFRATSSSASAASSSLLAFSSPLRFIASVLVSNFSNSSVNEPPVVPSREMRLTSSPLLNLPPYASRSSQCAVTFIASSQNGCIRFPSSTRDAHFVDANFSKLLPEPSGLLVTATLMRCTTVPGGRLRITTSLTGTDGVDEFVLPFAAVSFPTS
mmetsp:Transcript_28295/g.91590  ORF Transcript_28295/g.91590 Transcript_28295/m.91590 type:complete len:208 (-) Transcript_28295:2381-3004(-)